jgi:hypothetical protein
LKSTLFLHDYPAPAIPNIEKEYGRASPLLTSPGDPRQSFANSRENPSAEFASKDLTDLANLQIRKRVSGFVSHGVRVL